ncbi:Retrovirus-related Pol polyprotein from transposon TNT 1-94 [Cucumis melo var. makuwa]|uniref:Retrovirus-related Pol polyprotein from transposon TNT 1-94 n=1 Tax=Cucumis melo var. makuwa TaxID=1194695 RepID=A0A5A7UB53_CUCMM|nr:Retrovirus-related Pol polyprotein from transposon TNT 1-94 [Cucumis melo var. makuwa]
MRYKDNGNIEEYIMKMSNLAEEDRIKRERTESAHLAINFHAKKKRKPTNAVEGTSQQNKKQAMENPCFFYKKKGHLKKNCPKYTKWRVKKGKLLTLVCSEVNLASVPIDTWWVDSGATTHISEQRLGPFAKYLEECEIVSQYIMPEKPSMNGVTERRNRTLKDMTENAKCLKDVEFEGEDNIKKVVFGEELVSLPNVDIVDVFTPIPEFTMEPTIEKENNEVSEVQTQQSQEVPLRRSIREKRSAMSDDYIVFFSRTSE